MRSWKLPAALAALFIAALHYTSVPRSIWEFDESFFAMGVERYEPLLHHPPPPGYPLYIAFAKLIAVFTRDPFQALLVTSIIAVAAGFVAWIAAFRATSASWFTAVAGTTLLYASPAVLVSGTLPQSDSGALALFGLAAWACAKRRPVEAAVACALCIGWRPQFSIAVVPMFIAAVALMRNWRERLIAGGVFGATCLAWLVPLVIATGGAASFWKWLSGQAAYYAAHDADLSRSGHSAAQIALRFSAHPWGPKWLSIPLLAIAAGGAVLAGLARNARAIPLATGSLVYIGFALATMDPADAVRYAIPALPFVAFLTATALAALANADARWRPAAQALAIAIVVAYAAGAYAYASPILRARATTDAPPAAAARWIRANVPRDTIVLYDMPLRPHADHLLRGWRRMRIDEGLANFGGDPSVPMIVLADGEPTTARGVTFRWPDTDAYRKLTRRHYGAVSVVPLSPSERFRVVEGVYPPELARDGRSWRWIAGSGTIELPPLGATAARLLFRAPPESPFDVNRVHVAVDGRTVTSVEVRRGETAEATVDIPPGPTRVTFTPERTFVPASIRESRNRDRRTLSVMLIGVEQVGAQPAGR